MQPSQDLGSSHHCSGPIGSVQRVSSFLGTSLLSCLSLCFAHFITLTGWGQPLQYSAWLFHVPGRLRGLPTGSCSRGLCKPVPSKSLTFFLPISPFDAKNPFLAAVTTNRKLNQGTERHLMHLELDISDSKIRYLPPPVSPAASLALSPLCASS